MNFPATLSPDLNTRAGRMLALGRVKITVTSHVSGEHITILFKAFADNRDRQFKPNGKNWEPCILDEATHVFVEVPNQGEWNDKVGTFYPRTGKWYDADRADTARVYAAAIAATWVNGEWDGASNCQEASECARCGLELTDPVSIARGIGPVCLGKMTGSQHQVKVKEQIERLEDTQQAPEFNFDWSFEWATNEQLESIIANASRALFKRQFAREERTQEDAAYTSKMERDQAFLER